MDNINENYLKTVNVVFMKNNSLQAIFSFTDNELGNNQAEQFFADKILSIFPQKYCIEDISNMLDNGHFEDGIIELYITHSSIPTDFNF